LSLNISEVKNIIIKKVNDFFSSFDTPCIIKGNHRGKRSLSPSLSFMFIILNKTSGNKRERASGREREREREKEREKKRERGKQNRK
jgi:hypothetical protein